MVVYNNNYPVGCKRLTVFHELGLYELILLKNRYGLSVQAILYRALDLGIIHKSYYSDFYKNRIGRNRKETGWGQYPVAEQSTRFEQLLIRAVAEQAISVDKAAELAGIKTLDFTSKYQIT